MEAASARRILIVEDECEVVDLFTFNLREAGFAISTASRGRGPLIA
jgi:DNA-binding response OmpR family regulator